jgi:hypothetical protein
MGEAHKMNTTQMGITGGQPIKKDGLQYIRRDGKQPG